MSCIHPSYFTPVSKKKKNKKNGSAVNESNIWYELIPFISFKEVHQKKYNGKNLMSRVENGYLDSLRAYVAWVMFIFESLFGFNHLSFNSPLLYFKKLFWNSFFSSYTNRGWLRCGQLCMGYSWRPFGAHCRARIEMTLPGLGRSSWALVVDKVSCELNHPNPLNSGSKDYHFSPILKYF